MSGPMEGIKVVELGVWIAGPAAAVILADWGADVVKIEPPQGDPCRLFQDMLGAELPSNPPFELDNRSKRSVCLDLSTEAGRRVAHELVAEADVFVSNMRTDALARLGMDADTLRDLNPRLVYCAVTAYGLDGDDVNRPAFDIAAFWARSGIARMLTPPGGQPPFQRGGMGDHNTGLAAAGAISAALFHRERTGESQVVSTSLLREGAWTLAFDINTALMWGVDIEVGQRHSMGHPAATYYTAGDGRMFWLVGLEPDRHWPPLCRVADRDDWLEEPRYATAADRTTHVLELIAALDEIFATRPLDEWAERFAEEPDLFWAPINSIQDLIADPQSQPAGLWTEVPDGVSTTMMVSTPVDFHGTPWAPRSLAPELGEHTDDVLAELGYDEHQIAEMRDAGALG